MDLSNLLSAFYRSSDAYRTCCIDSLPHLFVLYWYQYFLISDRKRSKTNACKVIQIKLDNCLRVTGAKEYTQIRKID